MLLSVYRYTGLVSSPVFQSYFALKTGGRPDLIHSPHYTNINLSHFIKITTKNIGSGEMALWVRVCIGSVTSTQLGSSQSPETAEAGYSMSEYMGTKHSSTTSLPHNIHTTKT